MTVLTDAEKYVKIQKLLSENYGIYVDDNSPNKLDLIHAFYTDNYANMSVAYLPNIELSADTDEPVLPEVLHESICDYASAKILMKSDNTFDIQKGQLFMSEYKRMMLQYKQDKFTGLDECVGRDIFYP